MQLLIWELSQLFQPMNKSNPLEQKYLNGYLVHDIWSVLFSCNISWECSCHKLNLWCHWKGFWDIYLIISISFTLNTTNNFINILHTIPRAKLYYLTEQTDHWLGPRGTPSAGVTRPDCWLWTLGERTSCTQPYPYLVCLWTTKIFIEHIYGTHFKLKLFMAQFTLNLDLRILYGLSLIHLRQKLLLETGAQLRNTEILHVFWFNFFFS